MSGTEGIHGDGHGGDHDAPPPLPEPKTPMWLPAVGALLFLIVGVLWGFSASSPGGAPSGAGGAGGQAATAAPAAAPPPTTPLQGQLRR